MTDTTDLPTPAELTSRAIGALDDARNKANLDLADSAQALVAAAHAYLRVADAKNPTVHIEQLTVETPPGAVDGTRYDGPTA
jgi:hypothetical protein